MLETNIRIPATGLGLTLAVREMRIDGPDLSPDLLERACGALRSRHGLAAVPMAAKRPALLVASEEPLPSVHLDHETWELDLTDPGGPSRRLELTTAEGRRAIPVLIERAMLGALGRRSDLWTLDSPRIWYERQPFRTERGISAYRRYVISGIFVEDVGVGIVVDVGTAFFTTEPVSYYFDLAAPPAERERRACEFQALTGRQAGQKGTLVYDTGRRRVKCYCEQVPVGITCSTTGRIRVKNKTYSSLAEYYRSVYPDLVHQDHAPAARVSFPGLDRPQWAAADRLWARVMNDDVPDTLKSIDKLLPATRRTLLEAFWTRLEPQPFGRLRVGLAPGFWRPAESRVKRFLPGPLEFGRGFRLGPPNEASAPAYRKHYRLLETLAVNAPLFLSDSRIRCATS